MSGRLIGYPTGWTLAVFDDADAAEAAQSELEASGIGPDDLILLVAGPDASERMSRLGTSAGSRRADAARDAVHDDGPAARSARLRAALEGGRPAPGARIGDSEAPRAATEVIRRQGGHFVNRSGAWSTEGHCPVAGQDAGSAQNTMLTVELIAVP